MVLSDINCQNVKESGEKTGTIDGFLLVLTLQGFTQGTLFTPLNSRRPDVERFSQAFSLKSLMIGGKCSPFRSYTI
jgi:hypothetical protein